VERGCAAVAGSDDGMCQCFTVEGNETGGGTETGLKLTLPHSSDLKSILLRTLNADPRLSSASLLILSAIEYFGIESKTDSQRSTCDLVSYRASRFAPRRYGDSGSAPKLSRRFGEERA